MTTATPPPKSPPGDPTPREASAEATSAAAPPVGRKRWWLAVLVASACAVPCGLVLSFAALLPFFIGVFFFALFGLVLGALAFRIAAPGRPYGKPTIIAGTTLIVVAAWATSLIKESIDLPHDLASRAIRATNDIGSMTADEFRAQAASDVRAYIQEGYPPGGTLGYVCWVLDGGEIPPDTFAWKNKGLKFPQARYLFAVRVVLSIALLAFGVASQTWALKGPGKDTGGTGNGSTA